MYENSENKTVADVSFSLALVIARIIRQGHRPAAWTTRSSVCMGAVHKKRRAFQNVAFLTHARITAHITKTIFLGDSWGQLCNHLEHRSSPISAHTASSLLADWSRPLRPPKVWVCVTTSQSNIITSGGNQPTPGLPEAIFDALRRQLHRTIYDVWNDYCFRSTSPGGSHILL